jgi:ATP-dependent RNA helicase DeaD
MDSESYVHRIGRTGRAGRAGRALLFVENRERRLLRNIERTMKLTIPEVELPNAELLGKRRLEKFAAKVQQQLESSDLDQYRALLAKIQPSAEGEELDVETLAAALLKMAQGERPLIVPPDAPMRPKREFRDRDDRFERRGDRNDRGPRGDRPSVAVKIVRSVSVVTLAIWNCTALKWAVMTALKFVISLARLLTKATSAAVTSVTSSCSVLTPPSNCRKACRAKCCSTLRVPAS